mgnify:CR=1 FL=1
MTPPSELFSSGNAAPVIARFLPDQRFDLQATIVPDAADKTIIKAVFYIDGVEIKLPVSMKTCATGCLPKIEKNAAIVSIRALSNTKPGLHVFTVEASQSDGQTIKASGNFEIVPWQVGGQKVKNIIIMLGDGMGAAQRTAARIVAQGYAQGKSKSVLAMDTFPISGQIKTASLNSLVTDSAPGMSAYVLGNKNNNNEEGVFPDDTIDPFDNPRIEYSNMNVALDKIDGRRNIAKGIKGRVVDDYGFPDQPMLEEMTHKALGVLQKNKKGFVLMVEGASIDKQAHNMDTERWILDMIEFDRAIKVAQDFAEKDGQTLVIITADHECSGVALIGGSTVTDARLQELVKEGGVANLRDKVVGVYEKAGFPNYKIASDGYPSTTDIDYRLLIGYGGNSDRHEDWRTNPLPMQDGQQPFGKTMPLSAYPADPVVRDAEGKFMITGQVPGNSGVHTATDIPISAMGPGAWAFTGVLDNTDVFFHLAQAAVKGVVKPNFLASSKK